MSDKQSNFGPMNILGIALFAFGTMLGASVAMGWLTGAAPDADAGIQIGGFKLFDATLIALLGRPGSFVLAAVSLVLGARLWLSAGVARFGRQFAYGAVGTSVGTAILMGAVRQAYGGWLGAHIGSYLTLSASRWVSIPLGVVCVFVPVWFAWLRPRETPEWNPGLEPEPKADRSTESSQGVTAEEAAELFPRRVVKVDRTLAAPAPAPIAPPKPQETKVQAAPTARATDAHEPKPTFARQPNQGGASSLSELPRAEHSVAANPAGPNLARPATEREVGRGTKKPLVLSAVDELEGVGPAVPIDVAPSQPADPKPIAPVAEAPAVASPAAEPLRTAKEPEVEPARLAKPLEADPMPAPSWEQTDLFTEDEPVDAYGTPLRLIDELRGKPLESAPATEDVEEAAREAGVSDDETPPNVVAQPAREDAAAQLADEEEELELEEDDARFELAADLDDDEIDEDDIGEHAIGAEERDDDARAAGGELPKSLELGEKFDDLAADEEQAGDDGERDEDELPAIVAAKPAAPAPSAAHAAADSAAKSAADPAVKPVADPAVKPIADPDEALRREAPLFAATHAERDSTEAAEREVVIQPQPAPAAKTEVAPVELGEEDELVYKAGNLILERQRVAVSMLQREFRLDFEQATQLLDRLQAVGLIGPYLGGQRRDILLTLDQWRERVGAR